MKQGSILFLKIVTVLIGIVALAGLIRFPMTEGRAENLDLFSIYRDPFIAYMYVASIPFFVALYQAFKLLGYIGQNNVFTPDSVKALRTIKYCAMAGVGFIVVGEAALIITQSGKDDFAGPVALGIFTMFVSIVIATVTSVFEKILQNTLDKKI
ncbi:MAG: DUF2975 domain-containing protein [bacterium]|nr:DUF2975 domain-containing protein [bacterium]MDP3963778.1 DUF2975 domain-containing protein [bacterium]